MNPIIEFYNRALVHPSGYTVDSILKESDEWWENTHDFIQWIFPSMETSKFNICAPTLTFGDFELLKRYTLEEFAGRFYTFLSNNKDFRNGIQTHNDLRVTRAIKCMTAFAMTRSENCGMSSNFFWKVMGLVEDRKKWDTVKYWHQACEGWRLL
jgi:hypothetical protein